MIFWPIDGMMIIEARITATISLVITKYLLLDFVFINVISLSIF
jgi:hypothetical protein